MLPRDFDTIEIYPRIHKGNATKKACLSERFEY